MSKTYEELVPINNVIFRPNRIRINDFLIEDFSPRLRVWNKDYRLFDVSINGLSILSTNGDVWPIGEKIEVSFLLKGQEVYHGNARIVRTEKQGRIKKIGLGLIGGFINLNEIYETIQEEQLNKQLISGPQFSIEIIPEKYRNAVLNAVYVAQFYKKLLDDNENRYKTMGPGGRKKIEDLIVSAYKSLKARWSNIETDACIAAMEFSKNYNTVKCAKRYTERVLTSLLLESPMIFRSYTKPLGYPGDYQIMEYYYKNSFEGKNVFAKIFHKLFVEHPLSTGVCTRKDFIVQLLVKEHERFINQNKIFPIYRVTNLGCGPARDIIDFIQHKRHWAGEIELTLIDQENEALKLAYNNCAQEISRWRSPAVLKGFNISFTQLLQDPEFLPIVDLQHFIFSTGLFDYLGDSHAQELVKWFYDRLEKEGLLAIANAAGPNNHFWSPEFILDWTLRYRNKNEMMCLANKLPSSADVKVVFEPTEAYYFLLVRKH